jgi:hypothetical protein
MYIFEESGKTIYIYIYIYIYKLLWFNVPLGVGGHKHQKAEAAMMADTATFCGRSLTVIALELKDAVLELGLLADQTCAPEHVREEEADHVDRDTIAKHFAHGSL